MRLLITSGSSEGRVIDHPLHVARRMLEAGVAQRVPPRERVVDIEREYAKQAEAETPEAPDYAAMSKAELVEEAEARGLTVRRADGDDGVPLKADYIRALGG